MAIALAKMRSMWDNGRMNGRETHRLRSLVHAELNVVAGVVGVVSRVHACGLQEGVHSVTLPCSVWHMVKIKAALVRTRCRSSWRRSGPRPWKDRKSQEEAQDIQIMHSGRQLLIRSSVIESRLKGGVWWTLCLISKESPRGQCGEHWTCPLRQQSIPV